MGLRYGSPRISILSETGRNDEKNVNNDKII